MRVARVTQVGPIIIISVLIIGNKKVKGGSRRCDDGSKRLAMMRGHKPRSGLKSWKRQRHGFSPRASEKNWPC